LKKSQKETAIKLLGEARAGQFKAVYNSILWAAVFPGFVFVRDPADPQRFVAGFSHEFVLPQAAKSASQ
jgi:hypothetical protein